MIYSKQPPAHLAVEKPRETVEVARNPEPQSREASNTTAAITIQNEKIGDFASLAKQYENLALSIFGRWICAMAALALAAVVLTKRPKLLLKSAAIYTMAIGAIHFPFVGFPMIRPTSPTNASVPRWYRMTLAFMQLLWVPNIVIMIYCYTKRHNYSDPEKNRDLKSPSLHARLSIVPGGLGREHGSVDPLDNFALGAGIAGIIAFLACISAWLQVWFIQCMKWDPQAIADVHKGKMRENAWARG